MAVGQSPHKLIDTAQSGANRIVAPPLPHLKFAVAAIVSGCSPG
jgi:hypothetical protein